MADLIFNNFTTDRKYDGGFFKKILEVVVKELDLESKKLELSVNLVGEGRIKALNKKYRGRNRTTDVLSFPLQNKISTKSTLNGIMSLGDIFICLPVAKKYAVRESVSLDYKLAFLAIHGFLHLLGYDHEQPLQQRKMFRLQDKILKKVIADR
ncbi:MAG: rRNA maturation RNase YbeY [Candidatus Yanofskybacteria bacterium]|nr:rRNA maturation RNase YbeY [Candidatus Yanofskybacteria bacterium]